MDNLQYLNIEQVLLDIREFINEMNFGLGGQQNWILFGGSYAGMFHFQLEFKKKKVFTYLIWERLNEKRCCPLPTSNSLAVRQNNALPHLRSFFLIDNIAFTRKLTL